jgi:hypothetical protein
MFQMIQILIITFTIWKKSNSSILHNGLNYKATVSLECISSLYLFRLAEDKMQFFPTSGFAS